METVGGWRMGWKQVCGKEIIEGWRGGSAEIFERIFFGRLTLKSWHTGRGWIINAINRALYLHA